MPMSSGLPICTGAPCTEGKREVIWMARIASAGRKGRIETTSGPWNGPAASVGMLVRHIGTFEPRSICFSGMPSARSASSKENEEPTDVTPWWRDDGRLLEEHAVLPNPVARQVGADIEIGA